MVLCYGLDGSVATFTLRSHVSASRERALVSCVCLVSIVNKMGNSQPPPDFYHCTELHAGSCANASFASFYHFTSDSYRRATTHRIHTPPAPRSSDFPLALPLFPHYSPEFPQPPRPRHCLTRPATRPRHTAPHCAQLDDDAVTSSASPAVGILESITSLCRNYPNQSPGR